MKQAAVPLVSCPTAQGEQPCSGALTPDAGDGLPLRLSDDGEDILEGALRCGSCRAAYPVISGVAVLHPDPGGYLRRYYGSVLRDVRRHGDLSPTARTWLARRYGREAGAEDYGADFRFSQQFEPPWAMARAMVREPEALYGEFAGWLRSVRGPYEVLADWAAELPRERHLALDAGCGGGGLVSRIASGFQAALGVDLSFLAVLLARRAVLHLPEPERSYVFTPRRGKEVERPLTVTRAASAEFVVGDCCALPFARGLFDVVCSSNVIDIAGVERPLDEAARLVRPGGVLLLSDPFYFREGEAPQGEPVEVLRAEVRRRGFRIEAEQDGVPWAWATYDRHWRLYFNYCLAARRS